MGGEADVRDSLLQSFRDGEEKGRVENGQGDEHELGLEARVAPTAPASVIAEPTEDGAVDGVWESTKNECGPAAARKAEEL